jgi:recombinational DNA repair protein (RecF pathway)
MTGEQLEAAASAEGCNVLRECSKCKTTIDTDTDNHGISIDGENYVCADCLPRYARLREISIDGTFFAEATQGRGRNREELTTGHYSSAQAALKRAAEMAEYCWDVESFVEVN